VVKLGPDPGGIDDVRLEGLVLQLTNPVRPAIVDAQDANRLTLDGISLLFADVVRKAPIASIRRPLHALRRRWPGHAFPRLATPTYSRA